MVDSSTKLLWLKEVHTIQVCNVHTPADTSIHTSCKQVKQIIYDSSMTQILGKLKEKNPTYFIPQVIMSHGSNAASDGSKKINSLHAHQKIEHKHPEPCACSALNLRLEFPKHARFCARLSKIAPAVFGFIQIKLVKWLGIFQTNCPICTWHSPTFLLKNVISPMLC
jgi:hypothetical protein